MKIFCSGTPGSLSPRVFFRVAVAAVAFAIAAAAVCATGQSSSDNDAVMAQVRAVTPHVVAYAQVEPISIVPVSAAEPGVIAGMKIVPGMHVRAGQELARLTGPTINALLLQSGADVRSARSQLEAAQKSLAIEQQQLPTHLTTRQAVHQAEAAEAQAQTTLDNARSHLEAVRQMTTVSAPADGVVLALNSADGALVSAGQAIVTLEPDNGLWLRANYYGADLNAIRVGMTGVFTPANGSAAVPVRVSSIPGTLSVGGAESVSLTPIKGKAALLSGQSGTVTLDLPSRQLVAVPTRALILNKGKWWVMLHTPTGDRAQEVVPGPAQGWDTLIERGLAPSAKVIVNNAYLLFHASIAEQYQIPD